MTEPETPLVELRLFKVHPGTLDEFHRISRDATIPLMRRHGITVLAHGPSLYEPDAYYLVRLFPSEKVRADISASLYELPEWQPYDQPVMDMIADYHTVVMPAGTAVVEAMSTAAR